MVPYHHHEGLKQLSPRALCVEDTRGLEFVAVVFSMGLLGQPHQWGRKEKVRTTDSHYVPGTLSNSAERGGNLLPKPLQSVDSDASSSSRPTLLAPCGISCSPKFMSGQIPRQELGIGFGT